MQITWIDYVIIVVYLMLMLGIGFLFSRLIKGGKDFFVGGNLLPWWIAGVSLYMTLFSALLVPAAATRIGVNLGVSGLLFLIGMSMLFSQKMQARILPPDKTG